MKENRVFYRSPMCYVGDKYKIIPEIIKYFPERIERFIEPFTGGGSVFMNVEAKEYLLNDIDSYMVKLHKFLIRNSADADGFINKAGRRIEDYGLSRSYIEDIVPQELKNQWKKTYLARFNKSGYEKLRSDFNSSEKSNMLDLYLLLIFGFNRMLRFNRSGNFNLPVGNVDFNLNVVKALKDYFDIVSSKNIEWFNIDYKKFIQKVSANEQDFLYLDPPYLITFSEYNKLWGEKQEQELLDLLDKLDVKSVKFAISNVTHYKGRSNDIFIRWAKKYNTHPIKSNYISYHDNTIKDFNEVLVTNY